MGLSHKTILACRHILNTTYPVRAVHSNAPRALKWFSTAVCNSAVEEAASHSKKCTLFLGSVSNTSTCTASMNHYTINVSRVLCSDSVCASRAQATRVSQRGFHCLASINSGGVLSAKEKSTVGGVREGSNQEHGSVLMQFVEKKDTPKQLTVAGKVVQAGKDVSYLFVILAGFAVTGFLLWSIGSEFFLSDSPSAIFTKALKRVKADPRVVEALGEPITGHGDNSGRGRRRHIAHQEYIVDGVSYMRVKFYVDGSKRKGVTYLDLKKNDNGKYECRFLFVELQGYPGGTIVLEDNRQ